MTEEWSQHPDPAKPGDTVTITLDSPSQARTAKVIVYPTGISPCEFTVTVDNNSFVFTLPTDATACIIEDHSASNPLVDFALLIV